LPAICGSAGIVGDSKNARWLPLVREAFGLARRCHRRRTRRDAFGAANRASQTRISFLLCSAIIRVASNSADILILDQAMLGASEYSNSAMSAKKQILGLDRQRRPEEKNEEPSSVRDELESDLDERNHALIMP